MSLKVKGKVTIKEKQINWRRSLLLYIDDFILYCEMFFDLILEHGRF